MVIRVLALVAVVLAGCDPTSFRDCAITCTAETGCPNGFSCGTEGLCRAGNGQSSCADVLSDAMTTSTCEAGHATQLSGHVFAPNGTLPLPGVTVYVARTDPGPITSGLSCDRCDRQLPGTPIVSTTTDANGAFILDNVPAGDARLVIQSGKWRRQVMVPDIGECEQRSLDPATTRLPKNHQEGDLPNIALATGIDAMECAVLALGIDLAEFTTDAGAGKVHLYAGTSGSTTIQGGATLTSLATLTASSPKLATYDLAIFACEGAAVTRPVASAQNLVDYTTAGGRLFLGHLDNNWFAAAPTPWPSIGTFSDTVVVTATTVNVSVDSTSAQAVTLSSWLTNVGASTTPGEFPVTAPRASCSLVDGNVAETLLLLDPALNPGSPRDIEAFEMPTPIGGSSCGRVIYSDVHFVDATTALAFPLECPTTAPTPAQLASAYLLFELGACSR